MNLEKRAQDTSRASECYFKPYTHSELAESRSHRKFITSLSELTARLWMCVHFAENACDAANEGNHVHAYSYFKYLDLGDEYDQTSLFVSVQKVRRQIIAAGEGNMPVAGCIRSILKVLATYIHLRREIHTTPSILDADSAGRSLEAILRERTVVCGDSEKYERHVNELFDRLLRDFTDHYRQTCLHLCTKAEQQRDATNQKPSPPPAERPLKVEVVGQSRNKPRKSPAVQENPEAIRKRDDASRVIHEINKRHRDGYGSYPKIIRSMMSDPVWAARMKNRSAGTWKTYALDHKRK